ncbi:MAG: CBS domain-containing protein [Candidatus Methanomethylicia archaeon]
MPITIRVRDVMDADVYFINAKQKVSDAINLMLEKGVWSLIVEREGLPVGVITERDIIRRCVSKGRDIKTVTVEEIMSSPLITIGPNEPVGEAMKLMADKKIRRVYVVEEGKIIGRVTQTKTFEHMLNIMIALATLPYQI